jgi:hypothetical protein
MAKLSPELKTFQEESRTNSANDDAYWESVRAAGKALELQARREAEAKEQERQDKELQRAAYKKILESSSATQHRRTPTKVRQDRRDELIWSVVQEKPKERDVLDYCKRCNAKSVPPNPRWSWPRYQWKKFDWVKLYTLGKPWPKRIVSDKDKAIGRYRASHNAA